MRRVFGKHLIRGPDQDARVLGLEHEILIELFESEGDANPFVIRT